MNLENEVWESVWASVTDSVWLSVRDSVLLGVGGFLDGPDGFSGTADRA